MMLVMQKDGLACPKDGGHRTHNNIDRLHDASIVKNVVHVENELVVDQDLED